MREGNRVSNFGQAGTGMHNLRIGGDTGIAMRSTNSEAVFLADKQVRFDHYLAMRAIALLRDDR